MAADEPHLDVGGSRPLPRGSSWGGTGQWEAHHVASTGSVCAVTPSTPPASDRGETQTDPIEAGGVGGGSSTSSMVRCGGGPRRPRSPVRGGRPSPGVNRGRGVVPVASLAIVAATSNSGDMAPPWTTTSSRGGDECATEPASSAKAVGPVWDGGEERRRTCSGQGGGDAER